MERLVAFADRNRALVGLLVALVVLAGAFSLRGLPVDAVPDVTNVQVQVVSTAPELAPVEVERYVTVAVERALSGAPRLREVRSISRAGLSVVTAVFEEGEDIQTVRALVNERVQTLRTSMPVGVGVELGPISTGLGEIFQFFVRGNGQSPAELRTLLEWDIASRLRQVPGVTEVIAFGGRARQYDVVLDPRRLASHGLSLEQVFHALESNNANAGGGAIERRGTQLLLRGEAQLRTPDEIGNVVVSTDRTGAAVLVRHLGDVSMGSRMRTGAVSRDGEGEEVSGSVLMLLGANSRDVSARVAAAVRALDREMPHGVHLVPYYDRSELIDRTLATVARNLAEGALLVLCVLLACLGSLRAGVLVAAAIPFGMLFTVIGMRILGVTGNLMSLGAIDFGIVVDGAVVIVERMLHALSHADASSDRRARMIAAARGAIRGVVFSVAIILMVYLPLATLEDVEGRMFRPMVATMVLALAGALVYAVLVVPAFGPWVLAGARARDPWLARTLARVAAHPARFATRHPWIAMLGSVSLAAVITLPAAHGLGAEFIPRLDEGAFAIDVRRPAAVSLTQSVQVQSEIERQIRTLPEVGMVVSRTGRPEEGSDPQGPEAADTFVFLRPRSAWREGVTRDDLADQMAARLRALPGVQASFSQPIEMRVADLIAGVKSDVAIKVFGEDLDVLRATADRIAAAVRTVPGAADVKVETTTGMPQLRARVRRDRLAALGVDASSVLDAVRSARLGRVVGSVYEGTRRFDLNVRLGLANELDAETVRDVPVAAHEGALVPLGEVADVTEELGDVQVSREGGRRRVVVEANVRGRDLVGFVADAQAAVARRVEIPAGTHVEWGGQFANFERAKARLGMVVPASIAIILVMLLMLLRDAWRTVVVFLNVPLAVAGGVVALRLRGLPFSIPAGVGFIAVSGLAVLSGVLIVQALAARPDDEPLGARLRGATADAVRPLATAALVAAIGFVPMAVASSAGAEIQRPLATVVIGGVLSSAPLSLLFVPAALLLIERRRARQATARAAPTHRIEPLMS